MSHIRGYYCILNIINHPVFSYLKVMLLIGFIVRNHTGHYGPYFNHWYQCQFFKGFSIQNFQRFSLFSNRSNSVNIWARKMFVFLTGQNFARNLSFKFHKDQSFRWGDIAHFVTLYNLEVKIFFFFSSWIIAKSIFSPLKWST